ncbi:hypothetical protein BT69DRAFT_1292359 [Atractiella rhizophila]|nr:hypothetical protein BT69DRAFT_1292359 [Atractiella rhizophila]
MDLLLSLMDEIIAPPSTADEVLDPFFLATVDAIGFRIREIMKDWRDSKQELAPIPHTREMGNAAAARTRIFSARLSGENASLFQSYIFGELHCEAVLIVATPWDFRIYADETISRLLRQIQGQGIEVAVADVASMATIAATTVLTPEP